MSDAGNSSHLPTGRRQLGCAGGVSNLPILCGVIAFCFRMLVPASASIRARIDTRPWAAEASDNLTSTVAKLTQCRSLGNRISQNHWCRPGGISCIAFMLTTNLHCVPAMHACGDKMNVQAFFREVWGRGRSTEHVRCKW